MLPHGRAGKGRDEHADDLDGRPEPDCETDKLPDNRPRLPPIRRRIHLPTQSLEALDEALGVIQNDGVAMPGASATGDIRDFGDLIRGQDVAPANPPAIITRSITRIET